MPISVLLVDDHKVVREGYRRLLERDSAFSIIAEASTAESAYRAFCEFQGSERKNGRQLSNPHPPEAGRAQCRPTVSSRRKTRN